MYVVDRHLRSSSSLWTFEVSSESVTYSSSPSGSTTQPAAMFITLKETVKWMGMTVFEMWLNLITLLVFSVVGVFKYEGMIQSSWWTVFAPLFICDGLNAYFVVIVFIRMYKAKSYRAAGLRFLSSVMLLVCIFVFELLLCQKINGDVDYSYSEVFAPAFVALQFMMVRACQTHWPRELTVSQGSGERESTQWALVEETDNCQQPFQWCLIQFRC